MVRVSAETAAQVSGPLGILVTATDQTVTMLFSVILGLVAIVGFVLRDMAKAGAARIPLKILLLLTGFLAAVVWSSFLAYLTRLNVLRAANFSTFPTTEVERLVGLLGMFVAVSAALAVTIFVASYTSGLLAKRDE